MIEDSPYKRLLEASWRRKLTAAEEMELRDWLAAHPEDQAGWEAEAGLSDLLGLLPDVVVASNFTERLLQNLEGEQRADSRRNRPRTAGWWWRLVPKVALVCALVVTGFFSFRHLHEQRERVRVEVAKGLVTVSAAVAEVPSVPNPEISDDFDVIRLSPWLYADERLLTLLQ